MRKEALAFYMAKEASAPLLLLAALWAEWNEAVKKEMRHALLDRS